MIRYKSIQDYFIIKVFNMVLRTHLYRYHKENARLTEFAGFEMPLWYEGIIEEHMAVRNSVGIFDITHMGRAIISGIDAADFLDYILARRVSDMKINQGRYAVMLNYNGGIVDDLTVFRLAEEKFLIVYNASNREKDIKWIDRHSRYYRVSIEDVSDYTPMYAVQGPKAVDTLSKVLGESIRDIKRYWGESFSVDDIEIYATRTGYTGEDGFELYIWDTSLDDFDTAFKIWKMILDAGVEYSIKPCGLGARDTLRLEAGMCLYDHDINEETNPFEARLDITVSMDKENFIGKSVLEEVLKTGIKRVRVGITLVERGIPREGYKIYSREGDEIGRVTSGTFSPILKKGIGMGYVPLEYSEVDTEVFIDIRGRKVLGKVVNMPFYDTSKYGWKRIS